MTDAQLAVLLSLFRTRLSIVHAEIYKRLPAEFFEKKNNIFGFSYTACETLDDFDELLDELSDMIEKLTPQQKSDPR